MSTNYQCARICCAVVQALHRAITVSRTAHPSTGDSAGAPGLFQVDTNTAPFGSEDATPGSRACVRVRAPLGRVGRVALLGAFWCPSLFPVASLGALFICSAPSGLGSPCLLLGFFFSLPCCAPAVSGVPCFPARGALGLGVLWSSRPPPPLCFWFFFLFLVAPALSPAFAVFWPGVPWALASGGPPASPPLFCFFFLCTPAVSGVPCFLARGALGLGVLWSSAPPYPPLFLFAFFFSCFFCAPFALLFRGFRPRVPWALAPCGPPAWPPSFLSSSFFSSVMPPRFFLLAVLLFCVCFLIFFFRFSFFRFCLFFPALVCRLCSAWASLCVLGCGVCSCVLLWALCAGGGPFALALCRWVPPGCASSVCVVACCVAVLWRVFCFARCCVACLCGPWLLLHAAALCCRCSVPCRGPWFCSVLGCDAALL